MKLLAASFWLLVVNFQFRRGGDYSRCGMGFSANSCLEMREAQEELGLVLPS